MLLRERKRSFLQNSSHEHGHKKPGFKRNLAKIEWIGKLIELKRNHEGMKMPIFLS